MAEPIEGAASRPLRIRPTRLGVPRSVRPTFITAVLAGFAGFAVLGLFTAVVPAFMGEVLDVSNHAAAGLVVLAAFGSSALGQIAGRGLERLAGAARRLRPADRRHGAARARPAGGIARRPRSPAASSPGVGQGLSFAAGLAAVNAAAPADRRAATASSFFVVCYVAISIPVIGVGRRRRGDRSGHRRDRVRGLRRGCSRRSRSAGSCAGNEARSAPTPA